MDYFQSLPKGKITVSKIRILQLVNGFSIGGAERKLLELIKFIDREKFDMTICSVGIGGPLKKAFEETGFDVFLFTKKHRFDFTQVIKVAKLMKERKIDIVMSTLFYADIIGTLAALIAKVPYRISWETSSHPSESDEDKLRHRLAYRFCMKFVDKIVSVSDGVKQFLIKKRHIDPSKIYTIHYGADLTKFHSLNGKYKRQELGFRADERIIGTVARLTVQKGHIYLIDAAPEIIKKFPQIKFVFVGDGPLKATLENKIKNLSLESYFTFLGVRYDVNEIMNIFDIFMLPSLFEGLPNVILEAMASSRPIIATAVDGTPEAIIDGECGILVPPRDVKALSENAVKLLSNPAFARQLGTKARQRVEQYFSQEQQIAKFHELYQSMIDRKLKNRVQIC